MPKNKQKVIQEYLEDSKSRCSNGKYWLGGHIQMNLDDAITPELLRKVRTLLDNIRGDWSCNNFELRSVFQVKRQFDEIDAIVERYVEVQKQRILVQKQRILCELNKTKLNSDVNKLIIEMI